MRLGGDRFTLPRGTSPVELEIRAPGYKTLHERVVPDTDRRALPLQFERAPAPGRKKPGKDDIESF